MLVAIGIIGVEAVGLNQHPKPAVRGVLLVEDVLARYFAKKPVRVADGRMSNAENDRRVVGVDFLQIGREDRGRDGEQDRERQLAG